jgi:hypothetical protein
MKLDAMNKKILAIIKDAGGIENKTAPKICKAALKNVNVPQREYNKKLSNIRYRLSKLEREGYLRREKVINAWVYELA